jgi:hypothetical protein
MRLIKADIISHQDHQQNPIKLSSSANEVNSINKQDLRQSKSNRHAIYTMDFQPFSYRLATGGGG